MISTIRTLITRYRFAKATRPWDERIEAARANHAQVLPIMREKTEALHRALAVGK